MHQRSTVATLILVDTYSNLTVCRQDVLVTDLHQEPVKKFEQCHCFIELLQGCQSQLVNMYNATKLRHLVKILYSTVLRNNWNKFVTRLERFCFYYRIATTLSHTTSWPVV